MTKKSAHPKPRKKIDWDAVCERTRQRCNKLTEEEREHYHEVALSLIYGNHGQIPARRR